MSRRKTELFNLSFLDLLTSALGAIIFLFIITPKGGEPASDRQQVAVYIDTINHKVFGQLPDSLWGKAVGDTLFTVLVDYRELPEVKPEKPVVVNEPPRQIYEKPVKVSQPKAPDPEPKAVEKPKKEEPKTTPTKPESKPEPVITPQPERPTVYRGDAPNVPCKVSFEISWTDDGDNVDLFVCKGGDCVYGGRKRDRSIGEWDSGKSRNRLFGNDLRTNQEAVRQFDNLIPGEYTLYAHFKASKNNRQTIPIAGLIYTKGKNGQERGEHFSRSLSVTKDRVAIGKVRVNADGSFTFVR